MNSLYYGLRKMCTTLEVNVSDLRIYFLTTKYMYIYMYW